MVLFAELPCDFWVKCDLKSS